MANNANRKVWNEDLVQALQARYMQCVQQESTQQYTWLTGMQVIQAVRKDIYQHATGQRRIVNLPTDKLSKTVDTLCRAIIQGEVEIFPPGFHRGGPRQTAEPAGNPFERDPYLQRIKKRGGAWAILMAYHYSGNTTMTKTEICQWAQPYCDDQMEPNWHAGRTHGAWSGKSTLIKHGLMLEHSSRQFIPGQGFRNQGEWTWSITNEGKQFIQAMLQKYPDDTRRQQQRQSPDRNHAAAAGVATTPGRRTAAAAGRWAPDDLPDGVAAALAGLPTFTRVRRAPSTAKRASKLELARQDKAALVEWLQTARVHDQKTFAIGKDRRKRLHDLCDQLMMNHAGLRLHHESTQTGARSRTLYITLDAKPDRLVLPISPAGAAAAAIPGTGNGRKKPPTSSRKAAPAGPATMRWIDLDEEDDDGDDEIDFGAGHGGMVTDMGTPSTRSLTSHMDRLGLPASGSSPGDSTYPDAFGGTGRAVGDSSDAASPGKRRRAVSARQAAAEAALMRQAMFESLQASKEGKIGAKSAATTATSTKTAAATKKSFQATRIDEFSDEDYDDDDDDDHDEDSYQNRKMPAKRLKVPKRLNFRVDDTSSDSDDSISKPLADVVDLCNADTPVNGNHKIGASSRNQIHIVDLVDEDEPGQCPDEKISKKNSPDDLIPEPDIIEIEDSQGSSIPSHAVAIIEDAEPGPATSIATHPPVADHPIPSGQLIILIDDRERNRNHTPRFLRTELTRLTSSGPLHDAWPKHWLSVYVEERKLVVGDFAFACKSANEESQHKLAVVVERKRLADLVGRSAGADHWKQLNKMRTYFRHGLFLIEGDTRLTSQFPAYGSQNHEDYNPNTYIIDSEEALFRFMGRAILTSKAIKFVQTKDEQGSLRAIGAIGLMAAKFAQRLKTEAEPILGNREQGLLEDRVRQGCIPWKISRCVAEEIGSVERLDALYAAADETSRGDLLCPVICYSVPKVEEPGSVENWSRAIHAQWTTSVDHASLRKGYLDCMSFVSDHGLLLCNLHSGMSPQEAVESSFAPAETSSPRRRVKVHLPFEYGEMFPTVDGAFYETRVEEEEEVERANHSYPTIVLQTVCGSRISARFIIHVVDGKHAVAVMRRILKDEDNSCSNSSNGVRGDAVGATIRADYASAACRAAGALLDLCSWPPGLAQGHRYNDDRRVMLIRGIPAALDAEAKKPSYHALLRNFCDLVLAAVMIQHDVAVVQATKLSMEHLQMLVRQLALACLHHHLLLYHDEKHPSNK